VTHRPRELFYGRDCQLRYTIAPRATKASKSLNSINCTSCGSPIQLNAPPGRHGLPAWSGSASCDRCCPSL
jgi:hypothetical protein